MKTIKELSVERSIDRSTLLKAARRGAIPAKQSGATWLIDDEDERFKTWLTAYPLQSRVKGRKAENIKGA